MAWFRYLAIFPGLSGPVPILAFVVLFGGLAVGSLWLGARADRFEYPLLFFGLLEVGLGLYALAFPYCFEAARHAGTAMAREWTPGGAAFAGLKLGFLLLTAFLPAGLFGGTLPAVFRRMTLTETTRCRQAGRLYSLVGFGASMGILLGELWLVPVHGLASAVRTAALLNLAAGGIAMAWSRQVEPVAPSVREPHGGMPGAPARTLEWRLTVLAVTAAGFVVMLYGTAWTRLSALVWGPTASAFGILGTVFFLGLATGAAVIGPRMPRLNPLDAMAWGALGTGAAVLVSMLYYGDLPIRVDQMQNLLDRSEAVYPMNQGLQGAIGLVVLFPPTVLLGMTMPLALRITLRSTENPGCRMGRAFAFHVLGAMTGASLTGSAVLPHIGLAGTFALGVAVNVTAGLVILSRRSPVYFRLSWLGSAVLAAGFLTIAAVAIEPAWQKSMHRSPRASRRENSSRNSRSAEAVLKYHRDGAAGTVALWLNPSQDGAELTLFVNGRVRYSSQAHFRTQRLAGHIPLLLRPNSRRIAVVGLGAGMTCHAILTHSAPTRIDVVEPSSELIAAAGMLSARHENALKNPKVRLIREAPRLYLDLDRGLYDVIISQTSAPGIYDMYGMATREYFLSCRDRLAEDGLMVHPVDIEATLEAGMDCRLATFSSVFPHVSIWTGEHGELIWVGSAAPIEFHPDRIRDEFKEPEVARDLDTIDILRPAAFLMAELISQHNGFFIAPHDTPVHSDYQPILEPISARGLFQGTPATRWRDFIENALPRARTFFADYLESHPLTLGDLKALALVATEFGNLPPSLLYSVTAKWSNDHPEDLLPLELLERLDQLDFLPEFQAEQYHPRRETLIERVESDPFPLRSYAKALVAVYRNRRSVFHRPPSEELATIVDALLAGDPEYASLYRLQLAEIAWDHGEKEKSVELALDAFKPRPENQGTLHNILDPRAPYIALTRIIEFYLQHDRIRDAWTMSREAVLSHYVGPLAPRRDPWLELACRKADYAYSLLTR